MTQQPIKAEVGERRAGDPSKLIASSDKAKSLLGWQPQHDDINDIIASAWAWHNQNLIMVILKIRRDKRCY